ncbi:glutaredoxin family protein [Alteribacillus sp. HJP-4]|uniref:glutaredoxin family protein n=1 Tax=Alteribacillus sp. HJP-4 TaxID=2775394 RepID=UPI0035CD1EB3
MYTLELYTHPWCSDCKASKEYLKQQQVKFIEHNLSETPETEEQLKDLTGSRVVPGFVFRKNSVLGKLKKPIVFTGYKQNLEKIQSLVRKLKRI